MKCPHCGFEESKVGLRNVNERIKLYFGSAEGLQIESTQGKGTTVSFTIPYDEKPSALLTFEQHVESIRKEDKTYG